jgi:hypothetical protein
VENDLLLDRAEVNIEALAGEIEERFAACLLGRNDGVLLGRVRSPDWNQNSHIFSCRLLSWRKHEGATPNESPMCPNLEHGMPGG